MNLQKIYSFLYNLLSTTTLHVAKNIFIVPFFIVYFQKKGIFFYFLIGFVCYLLLKYQTKKTESLMLLNNGSEFYFSFPMIRLLYGIITHITQILITLLTTAFVIHHVEKSIGGIYVPGGSSGYFGVSIVIAVSVMNLFLSDIAKFLFYFLFLLLALWFFGLFIVCFDSVVHLPFASYVENFIHIVAKPAHLAKCLPYTLFLCLMEYPSFFSKEYSVIENFLISIGRKIGILCSYVGVIVLLQNSGIVKFLTGGTTFSEALIHTFPEKLFVIHFLNIFFIIISCIVLYFSLHHLNKFLQMFFYKFFPMISLSETAGTLIISIFLIFLKNICDPFFMVHMTIILISIISLLSVGINIFYYLSPLQRFLQIFSILVNLLLIISVMSQLI